MSALRQAVRGLRGICYHAEARSQAATLHARAAALDGDPTCSVPLGVAAYQIWGANTGVGKTLCSAGLLAKAIAEGSVLYLKPVQTGAPEESDARLVGAVCGVTPTWGNHAAQLVEQSPEQPKFAGNAVHTEFAWRQPVSPHLAVINEGRAISDDQLRAATVDCLNRFAGMQQNSKQGLALVETAGGPGSPGPSGRLQSDIFRPLRLPAVLIGDGRLGGISTTLAAFEMLCHRGFDVAAIALLESAESPNAAAIQAHISRSPATPTRVFSLPSCEAPAGRSTGETGEIDESLKQWLKWSSPSFTDILQHLTLYHRQRCQGLDHLAQRTLQHVWYPFTQHRGLKPRDITVIDARAGESMLVSKGDRIEAHFDACASWWTQGLNDDLQPLLASETMKGIARYGHVMHPNAAIDPIARLAEMLLSLVGSGWAERAFYSDDGCSPTQLLAEVFAREKQDWGQEGPFFRLIMYKQEVQ